MQSIVTVNGSQISFSAISRATTQTAATTISYLRCTKPNDLCASPIAG
jgi:hypothetical protein